MRLYAAGLLFAALVLTPAAGVAQQECELDESRQVAVHNRGTPYEMAYIGGPVLQCPNGVRITADSAIFSTPTHQIQFLGRVRFSDPQRRLDSDRAQYMMDSRHLAAQGDVLLVDHENGSTIRSPTLDYLLESADRPEARIEVYRGRPRTTLVSAGEAADSTIVDSDALSIIGQRTFIGRGDVVLRRGEMTGSGGELEYDQPTGSLRLEGVARMATPDYTLEGDTIVAELAGDTLREVTADGHGRLHADELDVDAPHIRVGFADGQVDWLVAFRVSVADPEAAAPEPAGDAGESQARVRSPEFNMIADSINVLAPRQQLERLVAVGSAFAERIPSDSAEIAAAAALPAVVQRDWVRGDTIVATFSAAPDTAAVAAGAAPAPIVAGPEPATEPRTEVVLDSLTVYGGAAPASSAYRVRGANEAADAPLTVNYLLAREIRIAFSDGAVQRVEAEGEIRGVHIRPTTQPAEPVPPRTVRR